jgi:hypothetical protein
LGREVKMSLIKTWYTVPEAESKFGVPAATILKWIEDGIVRTEDAEGELLINVDDLELKIEEEVL